MLADFFASDYLGFILAAYGVFLVGLAGMIAHTFFAVKAAKLRQANYESAGKN